MFILWHTLIIASFIAVAYWLGYKHGCKEDRQKETTH
jgi:hypothetical protein